MKLWLDVHLSPALAPWLSAEFDVEASHFVELGLSSAEDVEAFDKARAPGTVIVSKDADFPSLVQRLGPPPQVIWLTFGNTSNVALRDVLRESLPEVLALLREGAPLVEISGRRGRKRD